jgi:hypothetical protein
MGDLRQETLRAAVLGALRDVIDGEYQHARGQVLDRLLEARRSGVPLKSVDVQLPDGHKVAQITLEDPSRKVIVSDRAAFTEWVRKRAPEMVTQDPSQHDRVTNAIREFLAPQADVRQLIYDEEQWVSDLADKVLWMIGIDPNEKPEPRVSRSYEEALLASLWFVERDPDSITEGTDEPPQRMLEPETGEIVPGVEYEPAGEPTRFRMLYKPSSGAGREAIARAWRENRLPKIEGLPEVES